MPTVNNKLTNLANEIRELSGTTESLGLDEMATNVDTANAQVAEIEGLIEELNAALDGKSVSGGESAIVKENVTLDFSWSTTQISYIPMLYYTFWYNDTLYAQYAAGNTINGSKSIKVARGTTVCIAFDHYNMLVGTPTITGDISVLKSVLPENGMIFSSGGINNHMYIVNGNCSLAVETWLSGGSGGGAA